MERKKKKTSSKTVKKTLHEWHVLRLLAKGEKTFGPYSNFCTRAKKYRLVLLRCFRWSFRQVLHCHPIHHCCGCGNSSDGGDVGIVCEVPGCSTVGRERPSSTEQIVYTLLSRVTTNTTGLPNLYVIWWLHRGFVIVERFLRFSIVFWDRSA